MSYEDYLDLEFDFLLNGRPYKKTKGDPEYAIDNVIYQIDENDEFDPIMDLIVSHMRHSA